MSDFKYIKVNSSIHTASNREALLHNNEGDLEAKIALNFAENFLSIPKSDLLSLQLETTRMQLSLRNMPICELPLKEVASNGEYVSKCQLDVWPYCWLDDQRVRPLNVSDSAFPYYSNHGNNSLFNLTFPSNLENFPEVNTEIVSIKNIGTLEQIFQDAIENAIVFACSDTSTTPTTVHLSSGVKPKVSLEDRQLVLSYDSAPFTELGVTPVLWNQSFINNYESPQRIRDELNWYQPPPKRVFSYDVALGEDRSFSFTIPENVNVQPFNIVVNRAFKETFDFLPWITVDTHTFSNVILPNVDLDEKGCFYLLDCTTLKLEMGAPEPTIIEGNESDENAPNIVGNVRITGKWDNIPLVSRSPVA